MRREKKPKKGNRKIDIVKTGCCFMAKIVLIFGTPGAGKSSILNGLEQITHGMASKVNIGDEMLKIAQKEFGVEDRDSMRKLANYADISQRWRREILEKVIRQEGLVLIDTHASVKSESMLSPGLSFDDLALLKGSTKAIVYVDASTAEIIARRQRDTTRKREQEPPEEIDLHRSINISMCSLFSAYLNIPLYVINNREGKLEETRNQLAKVLEGLV